MVLVPLKKTSNSVFCQGVSVLFTEASDVWDDNSSSFYKLYCGWGLTFCWLSVGVCFVERTVLGSGCLVGLCEGIHFLCKEFRCRTYLFSSVDDSVDNR